MVHVEEGEISKETVIAIWQKHFESLLKSLKGTNGEIFMQEILVKLWKFKDVANYICISKCLLYLLLRMHIWQCLFFC